MFDEASRPPARKAAKPVDPPRRWLWTADKAALIAEYIHLFLTVTKHGVYLDLFAGPQSDPDVWAVKRVVDRRGKPGSPLMTHFAVCDRSAKKAALLRDLGETAPAPFEVYEGNANKQIRTMLDNAPIGPRTACFCLIDQRTFQCEWSTVRAVAEHKAEGFKIELFYFLAERWLDRSLSAAGPKLLEAWWGRPVDDPSFVRFRSLRGPERAQEIAQRFRSELGYEFVHPFAIRRAGGQTGTMYYMIHASDHPEAPKFMSRAYNAVPSAIELDGGQTELFPDLDQSVP